MSDHNDMPSRSVERDAQDNGYGGYELDPEQFEDICTRCGCRLADGAKWCWNCGTGVGSC